MVKCPVHTEVFDDNCPMCKQEYWEMKGSVQQVSTREIKKYKDFTEQEWKKYRRSRREGKEHNKKAVQNPRITIMELAHVSMRTTNLVMLVVNKEPSQSGSLSLPKHFLPVALATMSLRQRDIERNSLKIGVFVDLP
jgi:hypothetical protein